MTYFVDETSRGMRLDVFVVSLLPSISRASIQKLIDNGRIVVNGNQEKTGYKLRLGDKISVDYNQDEMPLIPDITLSILYEDDDCIVVNKPTGVLTHSKGSFNPEGTVATFIEPRLRGMDGERGGIVHRLDRATSGVIICAKHQEALTWLQKQFSQRKVKKVYIAVIKGTLDPTDAIIDMPIERNPKKPKTFHVSPNGKPAVTSYHTISSNATYSLLELRPMTGRTHQLRVHLAKQKHPIVGDIFYDGEPADRLYLHAHSLEITLPNKERKVFTVPVPPEFNVLVR